MTVKRMPVLASACVIGMFLPIFSGLHVGSEGVVSWLGDLATHWQWLFLPGLILFGAASLWGNRRWSLLFLALPLPFITASAQAPESAASGDVLTVASANVSLSNGDADRLVEWISERRVDVVAILEVSPEYADQLSGLSLFPFQKVVPSRGPFGIALLSRHPMNDVKVVYDADGIAHIEAEIEWQDEALNIIALHPMPPLDPHYRAVRDEKLQALAEEAVNGGHPAIILGDLNATPWSSAFAGLDDAGIRRATGLSPTWPAVLRGLLGIPIDHVLVTRHWGVVKSEVGPDLGSDHLAVLASLHLTAKAHR